MVNQPTAEEGKEDGQRRKLIEEMRVRLTDRVKWYLQDNFEFDATGLEVVEKLLPDSWSEETTIAKLEQVRHIALVQKVTNKRGYLVNALKKMRS